MVDTGVEESSRKEGVMNRLAIPQIARVWVSMFS